MCRTKRSSGWNADSEIGECGIGGTILGESEKAYVSDDDKVLLLLRLEVEVGGLKFPGGVFSAPACDMYTKRVGYCFLLVISNYIDPTKDIEFPILLNKHPSIPNMVLVITMTSDASLWLLQIPQRRHGLSRQVISYLDMRKLHYIKSRSS